MAIYAHPLDTIIRTINTQNKIDLKQDDYLFGDPVVLNDSVTADNTSLKITSKNLQSSHSGTVTVTYRRLRLQDVAVQGVISIPAITLTNTRQVYELLNRYYGTIFTDDDIVVRNLTGDELTIPGSITITAKSTSYGWVGSATIYTRVGGYELADHMVKKSLIGFDYPGSRVTRPFAHMYSYWRDFTSYYSVLQTVALGNSPETLLALQTALQGITGDNWPLTGTGRYSLFNAQVVEIVLPERDRLTTFNKRYQYGIRVKLDPMSTLGLEGLMTLHYNRPFDMT